MKGLLKVGRRKQRGNTKMIEWASESRSGDVNISSFLHFCVSLFCLTFQIRKRRRMTTGDWLPIWPSLHTTL